MRRFFLFCNVMKEKVSVLMSVKNEAKFIRECVDSILAQTHQKWELLITDDHSTDNTAHILEEYSKVDSRIKWKLNKKTGIIPALSQAYSLANGDYITRMDGDDIMPVRKLEQLLNLLSSQPPQTIATGKVQYFSDNEISKGYQSYENWLNDLCEHQNHADWIYRECVIASPNWLCRRETIDKIGGFNELKYPEDYDLVLKWHTHNCQFVATTEVTHLWRDHPERTSRNSKVYEQKSFFELKLPYFVRNFPNKHIYILGEGPKAKMTSRNLNQLEISHTNIINNKSSLSELVPGAGVALLAVYPDTQSRFEIEEILRSKGYVLGENVFYV